MPEETPTPEQVTDTTSSPVTTPEPPKPTAADRMAKVRAALEEKAKSHDHLTCRCPVCCRRRNSEGIPHPPRAPKVSPPTPKPEPAATPSRSEAANTDSVVVHDKVNCGCVVCRQWRTDRATKAAQARNASATYGSYDWDTTPYEQAELHLADLRREVERGARALRQRGSTSNQEFVKCEICKSDIPNGRWVKSVVVRNADTGLTRNAFFCSVACANTASYHPDQHGPATGEPTGLKTTAAKH